jgi:septum formation protein
MAKAAAVSEARPADLVIGADQVAALAGERLVKPENMETARRQLLKLCGKTHALHSAVAVARGGEILWQHAETAHLTMRPLTPAYVGRYLAEVGQAALESVGAYQLEGRGIQLFDSIDGDYFAILGLPLLPLLAFLRSEGVVE